MTESRPRGTLSEEQLASLRPPAAPPQAPVEERVQNPFVSALAALALILTLVGVVVMITGLVHQGEYGSSDPDLVLAALGGALATWGLIFGGLWLHAAAAMWQFELSERRRRMTR